MTNLRITLPLVDGSLMEIDEETGIQLIHTLLGDDIKPPPIGLNITIKDGEGKAYTIHIPYSNEDEASLFIRDEPT